MLLTDRRDLTFVSAGRDEHRWSAHALGVCGSPRSRSMGRRPPFNPASDGDNRHEFRSRNRLPTNANLPPWRTGSDVRLTGIDFSKFGRTNRSATVGRTRANLGALPRCRHLLNLHIGQVPRRPSYLVTAAECYTA